MTTDKDPKPEELNQRPIYYWGHMGDDLYLMLPDAAVQQALKSGECFTAEDCYELAPDEVKAIVPEFAGGCGNGFYVGPRMMLHYSGVQDALEELEKLGYECVEDNALIKQVCVMAADDDEG